MAASVTDWPPWDRVPRQIEPSSTRIIGEDLNVDFVVEGSVRKAGDQIRIIAQLIDSRDGFHIWAQTFNRQIIDIFEIQDEVALNIAQHLDLEISKHDRAAIVERPTENLEAYQLVLEAKSRIAGLNSLTPDDEFEEIHTMLQKAVELDPRYAEARGALSGSYMVHLGMRESFLEKRSLRKSISWMTKSRACSRSSKDPAATLSV